MNINVTFESMEEMKAFCRAITGDMAEKPQPVSKNTASVPANIVPNPAQYPQALVQPAITQQSAVAPVQAPVQENPVVVPTTTQTYSQDDLARAAMALMDAGRMNDLQALLAQFGVSFSSGASGVPERRICNGLKRNGGEDLSHSERQHALLSASSAHRWLLCTPSARLEEQFPDERSEAAAEGTLAHELCELKLRNYFFTADLTKTKYTRAVNKLKKDPLWKDEMDGYTDEYLDYIKSSAMSFPASPTVRIEERVDFSKYTRPDEKEPVEGTGIADCILISGDLIQVIDFKYGKGVPVSAEHNPQLLLYALGAYEACRLLYGIHRVKAFHCAAAAGQ